ncbi:MAG TPA: type I methionyl aminopeptidase [Ktedonobacteraceae bacterium]|jgi:methionyl aminopeptidase|nr:type I methionyl aminopeptidase [Ktedonobacteraceae bacterium]
MAILIKSQEERAKIREAGRIVAAVLNELSNAVRPGITTADIDKQAEKALKGYGAKSSSLGYHGYPGWLCASVNEEVVHGIPGNRVLNEGDVITLDLAANYNGWHADSAVTVPVGTIKPEAQQLLSVTKDALYRGIASAQAGKRLHDVSRVIQQYIEAAGFSIVRQYSGHGVGRSMHEDPQVLNYIEPGYPNPVLRPGMVIAIEPMVIAGKAETRVLDDKWTVVSADGTYAAHFEHTIAVNNGEAEILTQE